MTNVERDKISEKDLCARDRVARYARVRVCSNRDTCLLTAGNHFLQRRNSQIYNALSLIRENTVGPVRRKFAEKRIERERESRIPRNDNSKKFEERVDGIILISMSLITVLQEIIFSA